MKREIIAALVLFIIFSATPGLAELTTIIPEEDSPFAFAGPVSGKPTARWEDYTKYLQDLNVHWVRPGGIYSLNWGLVQPIQDGPYDWSRHDAMIKALQSKQINILMTIIPRSPWGGTEKAPSLPLRGSPGFRPFPRPPFGQGGIAPGAPGKGRPGRMGPGRLGAMALPKDLAAYKKFVQAAVERYDKDGIDDMDGLKYPIRYWMVANEPNHKMFWHDTPENYALLVVNTCEAVKKADPQSKIVAAGTAHYVSDYLYRNETIADSFKAENLARTEGTSEDGFFVKVFDKLAKEHSALKECVDVLDFHNYFASSRYRVVAAHLYYINRLEKKFDVAGKPIWITETGTYAGQVSGGPLPGARFSSDGQQTERVQAEGLLKRYVFSLAKGTEKIFWFGIGSAGGNAFFSNMGLLSSSGEPRLAYYTYKKMVEILKDSDWSNVIELDCGCKGVSLFEFPQKNRIGSVYVVWRDQDNSNNGAQQCTVKLNCKEVQLIGAIPKADSGASVTDYERAFDQATQKTSKSTLTISLDADPVYLLPIR